MSRYLNELLLMVSVAEQRALSAEEADVLRQELEVLDGHRRRAGAARAKSSRARLEGRKGNAA